MVQSSIFSQFAAVGGNPFNHFSLLLQKLKIHKLTSPQIYCAGSIRNRVALVTSFDYMVA